MIWLLGSYQTFTTSNPCIQNCQKSAPTLLSKEREVSLPPSIPLTPYPLLLHSKLPKNTTFERRAKQTLKVRPTLSWLTRQKFPSHWESSHVRLWDIWTHTNWKQPLIIKDITDRIRTRKTGCWCKIINWLPLEHHWLQFRWEGNRWKQENNIKCSHVGSKNWLTKKWSLVNVIYYVKCSNTNVLCLIWKCTNKENWQKLLIGEKLPANNIWKARILLFFYLLFKVKTNIYTFISVKHKSQFKASIKQGSLQPNMEHAGNWDSTFTYSCGGHATQKHSLL